MTQNPIIKRLEDTCPNSRIVRILVKIDRNPATIGPRVRPSPTPMVASEIS